MKNILILQGHPDANNGHFCDAIANSYGSAAKSSGHQVDQLTISELDFSLLANQEEFNNLSTSQDILDAQEKITWSDHLVIIYPLWLGGMPAIMKGFFEQVFRPGFAIEESETGFMFKKLMKGRSVRIFVTMGMPAFAYRWFYRAHTVKSLKRNILSFCGFKPVSYSIFGKVHLGNRSLLEAYLSKILQLGKQGK